MTPIISPPSLSAQLATSGPTTQDSTDVPAPKILGRPPKNGVSRAPQPQQMQRDTELKKLEDHLKIVGPTMEKMGCVLASEERRRTFLDDEDFEDEVWGSEHDPGDE